VKTEGDDNEATNEAKPSKEEISNDAEETNKKRTEKSEAKVL
jgi:hypothetical protein